MGEGVEDELEGYVGAAVGGSSVDVGEVVVAVFFDGEEGRKGEGVVFSGGNEGNDVRAPKGGAEGGDVEFGIGRADGEGHDGWGLAGMIGE